MKEAKHVCFSYGAALRGWLVAVALGLVWLNASAQAVSSSTAFEKFVKQATGAGKQTVGFARDGTPLAAPGVPSAAPDGGSGIKVNGSGEITNPSGNRVPVAGTGRVPNASIAGAVGRALGKILTPIAIGTALYELSEELGYLLDRNADGSLKITTTYGNYQATCEIGGTFTGAISFLGETCAAKKQENNRANGKPSCVVTYAGETVVSPTVSNLNFTAVSCFNSSGVQATKIGTATRDAQLQELLDSIAQKSGWPTSSAVARAAVEAANATGEKLPVEAPKTVTGPATSPGTTKTETSANPDGSTKTITTTTTHHHTYAGDVITTTNNTTINITNNGTQGNDTTEEKVEEPVEEKNPCEVNPDTLGCTELGEIPKDEIPKTTKNVTYTEEDVGLGSGACPPGVNLGPGRVLSFGPICEKLLLARPMILAMAAFTALLIVMGVRSEGT